MSTTQEMFDNESIYKRMFQAWVNDLTEAVTGKVFFNQGSMRITGTDKLRDLYERPIPMVLFCPACGVQHIDAPRQCTLHDCHLYGVCYAEKMNEPDQCDRWTNPPHRSHECQSCKFIWRPADVPTTGVAATTTRGEKDVQVPVLAARSTPTLRYHTGGVVPGATPAPTLPLIGEVMVNLTNECSATGAGCIYLPCGPGGNMQCRHCGAKL